MIVYIIVIYKQIMLCKLQIQQTKKTPRGLIMKKITMTYFITSILLSSAAFAQSLPQFSNGVLVNTKGMALYTFDKDQNEKSNCNGNCITLWPAVTAEKITPNGKYSIFSRDDGKKQLAYDGKPLYLYSGDKTTLDRNGDGFNKVWHLIKE